MTSTEMNEGCTSKACDWAFASESMGCVNGSGWCAGAAFLEAEKSDFHSDTLIKVTAAINAMLSIVPKDDKGRKLSFVHTRMGTMLAWVHHDGSGPDEGEVGPESSDEEIKKALKIKP